MICLMLCACDGHIKTAHTVTFDGYGILQFEGQETTSYSVEVENGAMIPEESMPEIKNVDTSDSNFLGWFEKGTDRIFDLSSPVEKDMVLQPRWDDYISAAADKGDAYLIVFSEDGLRHWAYTPSVNCILASDITLEKEWTPVGDEDNPFTGYFGGGDYTISGLSIAGESRLNGFFGVIGEGGKVHNLRLSDVNISAMDISGGIAGKNEGTIVNCQVSGRISSYRPEAEIADIYTTLMENAPAADENYAETPAPVLPAEGTGGIAGINTGTISKSSVSAEVYGRNNTGGIAGVNGGDISDCSSGGEIRGVINAAGIVGKNISGGTVENSDSESEVNGGMSIGGIAGMNDGGSIAKCTFSGTVDRSGMYVGGLVGCNDNGGMIKESGFSGAIVDSYQFVGGVLGLNANGAKAEDCFSAGSVEGVSAVGGVAGFNMMDAAIDFCYAVGSIRGDSFTGGLVGNNSGNLISCYFAGEIEGYEATGGAIGINHTMGKIENCCWFSAADIPGTGEGKAEGINEIGGSYTWTSAIAEMNSESGEYGYEYELNTGSDASFRPLIIHSI